MSFRTGFCFSLLILLGILCCPYRGLSQACTFDKDVSTNVTVTSSCTMSDAISIISGGSLTIDPGVVLTTSEAITVDDGSFNVDGTVNHTGTSLFKVETNGTLNLSSTGTINWTNNANDANYESNGTTNVDGNFTVTGNYVANKGMLNIGATGTLNVEGDFESNKVEGDIDIDGALNINGDFTNEGDITGDGSLTVDGTYTESGTNTLAGDCDAGCCGSCTALPVELVAFGGTYQGGKVVLTWRTASELNNEGFYVQESTDLSTFNDIGFVTGNGTTDVPQEYSFVSNATGSAYYRLNQVDYDGQNEYSTTIYVDISGMENMRIYPNPARDHLAIQGLETTEGTLTIRDVSGKARFVTTSLSNRVELPSFLSAGIYLLEIQSVEINLKQRLVISR